MTEIEAKDLFRPYEDEEKITPEKRMGVEQDMVNHPAHYTAGGIECIDAIKAALHGLDGYEGFLAGNAIKYLWRWKAKGGKTDLKKAVFYINRLTTEVGGNDAD